MSDTTQVEAATAESAKKAVSDVLVKAVEDLSGKRVLLVDKEVFASKECRDAATLAAAIVYNDLNPDGAWAGEQEGFRLRLAEVCAIVPPLSPDQVQIGLGYLREAFNLESMKSAAGRSEAGKLVAWAKKLAIPGKAKG